jgi:hypothetical protein
MNTPPTRRESTALYTASLFILIALTAVCLAISAADVIIQALADKNQSGQNDYRNLFVVGGSYVLLVGNFTEQLTCILWPMFLTIGKGTIGFHFFL